VHAFSGRSLVRSLAVTALTCALACGCHTPSHQEIRLLAESNAARYLEELADARGSPEKFELLHVVEDGPHLVLTFQAHHPEFFLYTHSRIMVTCDARTARVLEVRRPGS
jgi:hypothetical protein